MASLPFTPSEPGTRDEIITQIREIHRASTSLWGSFSTDAFFAPVGNGWSPAGNVRHLNKSMKPLARALRLPRFLLRLLFGKADRQSRTFAGLRDTYLGVLAKGGGAGSFAPEAAVELGKNDNDRATLMATRESVTKSLTDAIGRWNDADLDRYRLRHPLLGKLTVREMLLFTVYHNYHHVRSVASRLDAASTAPTAKGQ
jgi:hypothetical protein